MAGNGLITFTTDFGLQDAYVGIMKGAALCANPAATLVDLCHSIAPQNVREAAFLLGTAYPYFPDGTVHLVVVDPGVGSARRAVAMSTPHAFFVAPDNGVLSYVLRSEGAMLPPASAGQQPVETSLPDGLRAVHLNDARWWRPEVSDTFHGRDIFAPVAAYLARGVPLDELGTPISFLLAFAVPTAEAQPDGSIVGQVLHVDRFGNLITNVTRAQLQVSAVTVEARGQVIDGLFHSYDAGPDLLTLIGSSGYLEIAARRASAAARLSAQVGDTVLVRPLASERTSRR